MEECTKTPVLEELSQRFSDQLSMYKEMLKTLKGKTDSLCGSRPEVQESEKNEGLQNGKIYEFSAFIDSLKSCNNELSDIINRLKEII